MNDPQRPGLPLSVLRGILRRLGHGRPDPHRPDVSRPDAQDKLAAERLRIQVGVIRAALEDVSGAPAKGNRPPRDDADVTYLYRRGHALVPDELVPRLRDYFASDKNRDRFDGELGEGERLTDGLVDVSLPRRNDKQDDVLATLDELEREQVVERGTITPDHVVYVTTKGFFCPATEPEVPRQRLPQPWPPQSKSRHEVPADRKVRVSVVDTGLWTAAVGSTSSPWLEADDIFADAADEESVNPAAIHPYAGHGTFVAGVISCIAPETRVEVEGALVHGGAVYESRICRQLDDALHDDDPPQLISISAGTHTRGGHPMLSLVQLAQNHKLDERDDVLVVAAAGNDASSEPFWPAAFATQYPWVVSVGSVDPDAGVSDFSNVGDWVSVYARGRNHVNAFPKGSYTCYEPPNIGEVRTFDGLAQWSGTSFSTPVVTGLIAARMRETGQSAREAWTDVLATATSRTDPRGGAIKVVGPLT